VAAQNIVLKHRGVAARGNWRKPFHEST
jgi:hypothetical protein